LFQIQFSQNQNQSITFKSSSQKEVLVVDRTQTMRKFQSSRLKRLILPKNSKKLSQQWKMLKKGKERLLKEQKRRLKMKKMSRMMMKKIPRKIALFKGHLMP
jgi:hypothetical protein